MDLKKYLLLSTSNMVYNRTYLVAQDTGKIIKVGNKSIESIMLYNSITADNNKNKIKIWDSSFVMMGLINSELESPHGEKVFINENTFEKLKIKWIEKQIKRILRLVKDKPILFWSHKLMIAETDEWREFFDIDKMEVFQVLWTNLNINYKNSPQSSIISGWRKSSSNNIFEKEIIFPPINLPNIESVAVYADAWLLVKIPWTELIIAWFDETYTSDEAKIINWEKYWTAVVLDTEE